MATTPGKLRKTELAACRADAIVRNLIDFISSLLREGQVTEPTPHDLTFSMNERVNGRPSYRD
jgi:hypothetical protein